MTELNVPPMPFIVGVPRSGTTLLRFFLDSHPDLAIPQETHFLPALGIVECGTSVFQERFVSPDFGESPSVKGYLSALVREAVHAIIVRSEFWSDFNLSASELARQMSIIEPFTVSDGLRCFYRMYAHQAGKKRWGDKTPIYATCMTAIQTILPEAHFIHIIRDPRDVVLSHKGRKAWATADDVGLAAHYWQEIFREARRQSACVSHFMELRYEDLLNDTTTVLKQVCNFISLAYCPEMEVNQRTAGGRLNELQDSYDHLGEVRVSKSQKLDNYRNAVMPVDTTRIGRWIQELTPQEKRVIEEIVGDSLLELRYRLADPAM